MDTSSQILERSNNTFFDNLKAICIASVYVITSVFIILKNNEETTKVKLPPIVDYMFQVVQGILLFIAWNAQRISNFVLNPDDKKLLEELKETQNLINENLSSIATTRTLQLSEPINQSHTSVAVNGPSLLDDSYIHIPKSYLSMKNKQIQIGSDCIIEVKDTSR